MPEETKLEAVPTAAATPTAKTPAAPPVEIQVIALASAGLVVCFFLPWLQILFGRPSGFDLQKMGNELYLLWRNQEASSTFPVG